MREIKVSKSGIYSFHTEKTKKCRTNILNNSMLSGFSKPYIDLVIRDYKTKAFGL